MKFWKILGGVAGGVAVIVALPVAGPVGAITLAGAAIAGGVGGITGGVAGALDKTEEKAKKKGYDKGKSEENAKNTIRNKELVNNLKKAENRFKEHKEFEQLSLAMFAVGFSVANCDGELHPEEIKDIEAFISGETFKKLPVSMKNEISRMHKNPPNFNDAKKLIEKVSYEDWVIFDDLIDIAMHADGIVRKEEKAYLKAWKKFKKENKNV